MTVIKSDSSNCLWKDRLLSNKYSILYMDFLFSQPIVCQSFSNFYGVLYSLKVTTQIDTYCLQEERNMIKLLSLNFINFDFSRKIKQEPDDSDYYKSSSSSSKHKKSKRSKRDKSDDDYSPSRPSRDDDASLSAN